MNLLLVDDNINVLEALEYGIDYRALGIDKVFSSLNAEMARDIIRKETVHIMLTDIEMPGGSGLELLGWVNEQKLDILTMFCTSYANFNYAQKAVELHSFDYFLKPIDFNDIFRRLERAVRQVLENQEHKACESYGRALRVSGVSGKDIFWRRLLCAVTPYGDSEIAELAREYALDYTLKSKFGAFLCRIARVEENFRTLSVTMKEFVVKNVIMEKLQDADYILEGMFWYTDELLAVIFTSNSFDRGHLSAFVEDLAEAFAQQLNCRMNIYVAAQLSLSEGHTMFDKLMGMNDDNTEECGLVCYCDTYTYKEIIYRFPDYKHWEAYLRDKKDERLLEEIELDLLRKNKKRDINAMFLKAYATDFTQLMMQMLREYQLSASAIVSLPDYESKRAEAGRSLAGLIAYIEYILYQIRRIVDSIEENYTVVEKIKGWLDRNYKNTVERRDLENLVFLSGDYVTKLFKKVCGVTITDYIIDLRLKEAKMLLHGTDLSINEVAARVGYDNYAYFSRLFRKRVGCTPKEYRQQKR